MCTDQRTIAFAQPLDKKETERHDDALSDEPVVKRAGRFADLRVSDEDDTVEY